MTRSARLRSPLRSGPGPTAPSRGVRGVAGRRGRRPCPQRVRPVGKRTAFPWPPCGCGLGTCPERRGPGRSLGPGLRCVCPSSAMARRRRRAGRRRTADVSERVSRRMRLDAVGTPLPTGFQPRVGDGRRVRGAGLARVCPGSRATPDEVKGRGVTSTVGFSPAHDPTHDKATEKQASVPLESHSVCRAELKQTQPAGLRGVGFHTPVVATRRARLRHHPPRGGSGPGRAPRAASRSPWPLSLSDCPQSSCLKISQTHYQCWETPARGRAAPEGPRAAPRPRGARPLRPDGPGAAHWASSDPKVGELEQDKTKATRRPP